MILFSNVEVVHTTNAPEEFMIQQTIQSKREKKKKKENQLLQPIHTSYATIVNYMIIHKANGTYKIRWMEQAQRVLLATTAKHPNWRCHWIKHSHTMHPIKEMLTIINLYEVYLNIWRKQKHLYYLQHLKKWISIPRSSLLCMHSNHD